MTVYIDGRPVKPATCERKCRFCKTAKCERYANHDHPEHVCKECLRSLEFRRGSRDQ